MEWQRFLRRDRGTYGPEIKAGETSTAFLFLSCSCACACLCDVKIRYMCWCSENCACFCCVRYHCTPKGSLALRHAPLCCCCGPIAYFIGLTSSRFCLSQLDSLLERFKARMRERAWQDATLCLGVRVSVHKLCMQTVFTQRETPSPSLHVVPCTTVRILLYRASVCAGHDATTPLGPPFFITWRQPVGPAYPESRRVRHHYPSPAVKSTQKSCEYVADPAVADCDTNIRRLSHEQQISCERNFGTWAQQARRVEEAAPEFYAKETKNDTDMPNRANKMPLIETATALRATYYISMQEPRVTAHIL